MAAELQAAFKAAAKELEGKKGGRGMKGSDKLVDTLEGIKEAAGKGHGDIVKSIVDAVEDFLDTLKKTLADPSGAGADAGGCTSFCAKWYSGQVASKLQTVNDEGVNLLQMFRELERKLGDLLADMGSAMSSTMPIIKREVKELISFPQKMLQIADTLEKGTEAIANIDMKPLEKSLDVSPINEPLDNLKDLKTRLGPTIDEVKAGVQKLSDFKAKAPGRVKGAFDVGCVPMYKAAPPAMKELLGKLDALKALNLKPLIDMLAQSKSSLGGLDVEKIKKPMVAFSDDCKEQTSKLTDLVEKAKEAAGALNAARGVADALGKGDIAGAGGMFSKLW
mmetsp:Transcript_85606/g.239071  ORF Transcript_85606/g.239071 Transcript_85606/m.239071 type:complete len:335 (-) Transcript_85606:117-1121(-)